MLEFVFTPRFYLYQDANLVVPAFNMCTHLQFIFLSECTQGIIEHLRECRNTLGELS